MMHMMERYFTNGGNMEITDAIAEGLLRTVIKNAVILYQDPEIMTPVRKLCGQGALPTMTLPAAEMTEGIL